MLQRPFQALGILILDLIKPGQGLRLCLFQQGRGRGGHHGHSHQQGSHEAVADAQGHGQHQVLDQLAGKDHRQKDAHRGQGRGHDGHTHLFGALHRCTGCRHAAAQAVDILDDHDGVVHQHTNAQGQARQGHHVQVHIREVHQHQRKQHRQGDADADHDGGLEVLEEDGQHQNGQHCTQQHTAEDALDDDGDIVALVGHHHHMQAGVLLLQLIKGRQAVAGHLSGAGIGALIDLDHGGILAVQAGKGSGCVVDDLHVRHICQAHVSKAIHPQQQRTGDILHAAVLLAHLQKPGLAVLIGDITRRHREVLGIDQGRQGLDIQLLGHIGAGQSLLFGLLIILLGSHELLFVLPQHIGRLVKGCDCIQLLLRELPQRCGEAAHHLRHIVHGLDGVFQRFIDNIQALLHFQAVCQIRNVAALAAALRIQAGLQVLQCGGELIGDGAQLCYDLDEGVDVPHTGLVELIHHMLQPLAHFHQSLLDLRLIDDGDQLVDALQQRLGLGTHRLHGLAHLVRHLFHHLGGDVGAKVLFLLIVLRTASLQLCLGCVQLGLALGQADVDHLQHTGIDLIDLFLVQLHLHHLVHKTSGGHAGHTVRPLQGGHQGIRHIVGQLVQVRPFLADSRRHKGIHVQAVLDDGGGHAAFRQAGSQLVDLVGDLDQGAVHIRRFFKPHQKQAEVFRRCSGDLLHAGDVAQAVLHHVRDFALDTLRAGARVHRHHHQVRGVHIGQQVGLHTGH